MKDNSHSNIVVLHNTHKPYVRGGDYYPLYIPGVGTAFPKIGEMHESADGKSQAVGGEARIHYAMIQIYNAVHRAVFQDSLLVSDDDALSDVNSYAQLKNAWTLSGNKRRGYFKRLGHRLENAILNKKPQVIQINISIFGFSRGAAQARTFSNWLLECCKGSGTDYKFCGIPIKFQFLGIFDTVASVGLADASPTSSGLMDWADGTMDIPKAIARTVHYVAAHEVRQNFPLSSARSGKAYPGNCIEVVYPGAHSDVGGGYGPGEQGKAMAGRDHMASQIPLVSMYLEAMKSGVPLRTVQELEKAQDGRTIANLKITPTLAERFKAYVEWTNVQPKKVESMLVDNMRHYWHWRWRHVYKLRELPSYKSANAQDKDDMEAGNEDFKVSLREVDRLESDNNLRKNYPVFMRTYDVYKDIVNGLGFIAKSAPVVRAAVYTATLNDEKVDPLAVALALHDRKNYDEPLRVHEFFDQHIHDSHASFRLLGPLTLEERLAVIKNVKEKHRKWEQSYKYPHAHGGVQPKLNPLEQRIFDLRQENELKYVKKEDADRLGDLPVMHDSDLDDLRAMTGFVDDWAVRLITKGRRESGSFLRLRKVFDES